MTTELFNQMVQTVTSSMEAFQVGPLRVKVAFLHDSKLKTFTTEVHEHFFYELCILKKDSCAYYVQEQNIIQRENDNKCVLIPASQLHLRKSAGKLDTVNISMIAHLIIEPLSPQYILDLSIFRENIFHCNFQFRQSRLFQSLERQFRTIVAKQKPYWVEYASCKLKELMLSFFLENFPNLPVREYTPSVRKNQEVMGRLHFMLQAWIGISQNADFIAGKVGLSARHLSRIVEQEFGMTLSKYIMQKRMEHAKELLSGNTQLVKDVATNLGYRDTAHFCRVFHKFFGITPKQYVLQQQAAAYDHEEKKTTSM